MKCKKLVEDAKTQNARFCYQGFWTMLLKNGLLNWVLGAFCWFFAGKTAQSSQTFLQSAPWKFTKHDLSGWGKRWGGLRASQRVRGLGFIENKGWEFFSEMWVSGGAWAWEGVCEEGREANSFLSEAEVPTKYLSPSPMGCKVTADFHADPICRRISSDDSDSADNAAEEPVLCISIGSQFRAWLSLNRRHLLRQKRMVRVNLALADKSHHFPSSHKSSLSLKLFISW